MTTTEAVYRVTVMLHLCAGLLALAAFWIPALTRKGSRVHRRAGTFFMAMMLVVIVTGVPLAVRHLWLGNRIGGTFLAYLAVIVATSVGCAWFALKLKHDPVRYYGTAFQVTAIINIASGIAVLVIGYLNSVPLLMFFSFVGQFAGIDMLNKSHRAERDPNWWLLEHLGGMLGAGIAAHVAFGVFGLRRIWPAYASLDDWTGMLPWLLPLAIGIPAATWQARKYRSQRTAEMKSAA